MRVVAALTIFILINAVISDMSNLIEERKKLLQNELDVMLGSDIELSDIEQKANDIIMAMKRKELDDAFENPHLFKYSKHFFEYKEDMKQSPLFKVIQQMPKGAVLHAHDTGLLSPDYVVKLTYWDNLYVCYDDNNIQFIFSASEPTAPCRNKWINFKSLRDASGNVEKIDSDLKKHFSIVVSNPHEQYTNVNKVWNKFQNYFICSHGLMTYKPVWEQYFYDTLKACRDDNVMYIEIRSVLPELYDLEGNVYNSVATAEVYHQVVRRFVSDYPDFHGAKLIYAPLRMVNVTVLREYIKIAKELKKRLPDFFAGFDLVGQEDLGKPILEFMPDLIEAAKDGIDFFFHAGETNWYGTSSDENLIDAIVLNTKRIGHGFALVKHPVLMEEVKKRDIALEVNVLSNAVLKLVDDVRNHPLATFIARGLPVVLSSDDPGVWEAEPLSHDFYVTFVGVASRHADLRLLKKLALNSLYYSAYSKKDIIVLDFEKQWTKFIDKLVMDNQ